MTNTRDGNVSVIDTATNAEIDVDGEPTNGLTRIAVGTLPQGVAVHPAGTFVYVTNDPGNIPGVFWVMATATKTLVASVPVGNAPKAFGQFVGPTFIVTDTDSDGLTDDEEIALGTDPNDPDTDEDGLLDGTEVEMAMGSGCPDPRNGDSDDDTLLDGNEVAAGTNPCNADRKITSLRPALLWVGLKNSDAVGLRLDLKAAVFLGGATIDEGQLNNVTSGSSGFNNAQLNTIPLTLSVPVEVPANAKLEMTLSVRRTCFGGGHNSGTPRLWFNESQANSRFGATIADVTDEFALAITPGPGPKRLIDVVVDSKTPCPDRPFKPFGTWSLTLS